jgi:hypothetical protein
MSPKRLPSGSLQHRAVGVAAGQHDAAVVRVEHEAAALQVAAMEQPHLAPLVELLAEQAGAAAHGQHVVQRARLGSRRCEQETRRRQHAGAGTALTPQRRGGDHTGLLLARCVLPAGVAAALRIALDHLLGERRLHRLRRRRAIAQPQLALGDR